MRTDPRRTSALAALLLAAGLAGCETPSAPAALPAPEVAAAVAIPAEGTASTLDFGTWNVEWFGSTSNGPTNETLQLQNVRDVIAGTDLDVWGVQEVVSETHFASLLSQLPGYAGLLANDPSVTDGPAYYNGFSGTEQKVGIVYKTSVATVQGARIILTAYDYEFAGRPPLEVRMRVSVGGVTEDVVVIVLHAKAGTGGSDVDRRRLASEALKAYLDATYPTQKVIVIGDFNDDVDVSISGGATSPYANFVLDSARYRFPTGALSAAGATSTVRYADMVDHHLGTNEFWSVYVPGSAEVLRVDQYIASYGTTTSDHYPIATRYTVAGSTANAAPTAAYTFACTALACTFDGGASTDSDGTVVSYAWSFGDGASATGATAAHTFAAGGTYTVTLTVTDDAGASDAEAKSVTVSAPAGGGITLSATGYKVKGLQQTDLAWSGAGSTSVDVYRGGARVATTANDGAYTDAIGQKGTGSYTYRVCEAGTSTCSANVTVTF